MPNLLVACVILSCQIMRDSIWTLVREASQNYCKSPCRSPKKIKVFRGTTTKTDLVSDSVKVDFSVIRDETAPLRLLNNRKCLFL